MLIASSSPYKSAREHGGSVIGIDTIEFWHYLFCTINGVAAGSIPATYARTVKHLPILSAVAGCRDSQIAVAAALTHMVGYAVASDKLVFFPFSQLTEDQQDHMYGIHEELFSYSDGSSASLIGVPELALRFDSFPVPEIDPDIDNEYLLFDVLRFRTSMEMFLVFLRSFYAVAIEFWSEPWPKANRHGFPELVNVVTIGKTTPALREPHIWRYTVMHDELICQITPTNILPGHSPTVAPYLRLEAHGGIIPRLTLLRASREDGMWAPILLPSGYGLRRTFNFEDELAVQSIVDYLVGIVIRLVDKGTEAGKVIRIVEGLLKGGSAWCVLGTVHGMESLPDYRTREGQHDDADTGWPYVISRCGACPTAGRCHTCGRVC